MASLYNISSDLLELFEIIEENEGEITPEQEVYLSIKEEELNSKLENYAKAVKQFEADIVACKEEEKRIKSRRDIYSKRVDRLKKVMLDAVQLFGQEGKTGNKFIELPTMRLGTRNTKSVSIDEYREQEILDKALQYIEELIEAGVFDSVDKEGFVESLNASYKADFEANPFNADKEFVPITMGDLKNLKCSITFESTLEKLLSNKEVLEMHLNPDNDSDALCNTDKASIKEILPTEDISFAKLNNNVSLQIK